MGRDRAASDIMRAVAKKAKPERPPAPLLLLLLLAGFLVLAAIPDDRASVRVAGMSVLWWYGGLVAPVLAVVIATLGARTPRDKPGRPPDLRPPPR
jgi:hypothetical protein